MLKKSENFKTNFQYPLAKHPKMLSRLPILILHAIGLDWISTSLLHLPLHNLYSINLPSSIVSLYDDISYLLRHGYPLLSGRFVVAAVSDLLFCEMHFSFDVDIVLI
jgi:hypothetical protein